MEKLLKEAISESVIKGGNKLMITRMMKAIDSTWKASKAYNKCKELEDIDLYNFGLMCHMQGFVSGKLWNEGKFST